MNNSRVLEYILRLKDEASKEAEKAAKNIDGAMRDAQKGSLMFAGALAGVALATKKVVDNIADMEMLRSSFDTLTGSAEQGAAVFKELSDFAAKTPFNTQDLAKATQTMLSFGISADDSLQNLKMLGDISMGNSQKLSLLSLAFSQVTSTGRLMGQDLLQMINSGFNPLAIISQKTGKSMAVLKKEMEQGAISAEMVRDAMVTATSAGGLFFGGMERGSRTITGLISTLGDTFWETMRSIAGFSEEGELVIGGLADTVRNALTSIITFIEEHKETFVAFFKDSFQWAMDNLPIVIGIIAGGLIPTLYGLAGGIYTVMAPLIPFMVIGAALGVLIQLIVDKLGGWEQAQTKVGEAANTLWTKLQEVWDWIVATIKPTLDAVYAELAKFWEEIEPQYSEAMEKMRIITEVFFEYLKPIINMYVEYWKMQWENVKLIIGIAWELIKVIVRTAWSYIETIIKVGLALMQGDWKGAWTAITDMFKTQWTIMEEFIKGVWGRIKSYVASGVNGLIDIINGFIDGVNKLSIDGKGFSINRLSPVSFDKGGWVNSSGLAMVHKGEYVLSRDMLAGRQPVASNVNNYSQPISVNAVINNQMDAFELAHILGFELDVRRAYV